MKLRISSTPRTVPRNLQIYSNLWKGPRPGIISCDGLEGPPDVQGVTINVLADGRRDRQFLAFIRASPDGNSFGGIPCYETEEAAPGETVGEKELAEYGAKINTALPEDKLASMGLRSSIIMLGLWQARV